MAKCYSYYAIMMTALIFYGCSKEDIGSTFSNSINVYGLDYTIGNSILWENNPKMVFEQVPYSFTYTDDIGEVTIDGYACETEITVLGNYILSLYENSLNYIEDLGEMNGEGVATSIHFTTSDAAGVADGTYAFSDSNTSDTFCAYHSSYYSTSEDRNIATITDGSVEIKSSGDTRTVDYNLITSNGGVVSGTYEGEIIETKVESQAEASAEDILIMGYQIDYYREQEFFGMISTYGPEDMNSTAFYSTTTGSVTTAKDGSYDKVDIALLWNQDDNTVSFASPIEICQYTERLYIFLNHTEYAAAPADFTDEDYYSVSIDDIPAYFENPVNAVFSVENFEPGYVFFKSGQGLMGVIKVKEVTPGEYVETTGIIVHRYTLGPQLLIDVRSPGNFTSPLIK